MRLFTAIDLPDEIRTQVASLQAPKQLDARWSSPEQFHVTLRFIGETPPEKAERYETALAALDAPAATCVPYGLDALPSRRTPRVLVVGLKRTDALLTVYRAVSEALEEEGLEAEDRRYRPHVTLARLDDASPSSVHRFLDAHSDQSPPPFRATEFHLYESTLTDDGAEHQRRASIPLRT